jgi:integrase
LIDISSSLCRQPTANPVSIHIRPKREQILEAFRSKRPHYYRFVFFQFWQGTGPSEAIALTRGDIDFRYATARINKSIVQGHEGGTNTVRSNREIHLHENVMKTLSEENPVPLSVDPEDLLFTTPQGNR